MTARQIADALIADKAPQATRKQAIDLQAAILSASGSERRNGDWRGHASEMEGWHLFRLCPLSGAE